jgi:hypothetical protein
MTAPARRTTAAAHTDPPDLGLALATWEKAVEIRREWLAHGLATDPADRTAVEHSLARLYTRRGRPRPDIIWVHSPRAAAPLVTGLPTHDELHRWVYGRPPPGRPPFASDLAASLSHLRSVLDGCIASPGFDRPPPSRTKGAAWPALPPLEAIRFGVPFLEVLRRGVRSALHTSLAGLYLPVRASIHSGPVCWYGQQEAWWIAYYDAWRRLGLATYRRPDAEHLDDWAALARGGGWWWPGEGVCVVSDRPELVRTRPVPGSWYEHVSVLEVRYRDGWTVHCSQ